MSSTKKKTTSMAKRTLILEERDMVERENGSLARYCRLQKNISKEDAILIPVDADRFLTPTPISTSPTMATEAQIKSEIARLTGKYSLIPMLNPQSLVSSHYQPAQISNQPTKTRNFDSTALPTTPEQHIHQPQLQATHEQVHPTRNIQAPVQTRRGTHNASQGSRPQRRCFRILTALSCPERSSVSIAFIRYLCSAIASPKATCSKTDRATSTCIQAQVLSRSPWRPC
jgi:hypothetical protein